MLDRKRRIPGLERRGIKMVYIRCAWRRAASLKLPVEVSLSQIMWGKTGGRYPAFGEADAASICEMAEPEISGVMLFL